MSFREFMRGKVDAQSTCAHCGKLIEHRGSLWYASGESAASDICRKTSQGAHEPTKTKKETGMTIQGRLEKYRKAVAGGLTVKVPVGATIYFFKFVVFGGTSPTICMKPAGGDQVCHTAAEWKRLGAKW